MNSETKNNKAEDYFSKAKKAFAAGDAEKAEKFLLKAESLDPSERTKMFLAKVRAVTSSGDGQETSKNVSSEGNTELREDKEPSYTPEQLQAVQHILQLKDYYEILGVPTDASESDIQKAVRKLAREIHPDKNSAPEATEAMKAVNYAAAVLLMPTSRLEYDRQREDALRRDLTPEEMFNKFFSPENMPNLEKAMPWLIGAAGAALVGVGAYALYNAISGRSENGGRGGKKRRIN